jgi:WD40 repeat protein
MSNAGESLTNFITPIDTGAHVTAAAFLGETALFALGDGTVVIAQGEDQRRLDVHPGGSVLVAAADGRRFVTGGDDGRVISIAADGAMHTVAQVDGGRWIDALALGPEGSLAWSSGRAVTARDGKGWTASIEAGSTVRGLAFAPKGFQLAIAHYNGATLWFPRAVVQPKSLTWKGSHIDVIWSPDARFVVTTLQENSLHGWRVADSAHMRMTGYPSKTRSLSWSPDGKWLATSGADAAILWPFQSKEGPMGKPPKELAVRPSKIARVAFHPKAPVLASGFDDGCILLSRITDGGELLARPPGQGGGITALAWDASGRQLAFGTEEGHAGVLSLPKM